MTLQTAKNKVLQEIKTNKFAKKNGLNEHHLAFYSCKQKLSNSDAIKFSYWFLNIQID